MKRLAFLLSRTLMTISLKMGLYRRKHFLNLSNVSAKLLDLTASASMVSASMGTKHSVHIIILLSSVFLLTVKMLLQLLGHLVILWLELLLWTLHNTLLVTLPKNLLTPTTRALAAAIPNLPVCPTGPELVQVLLKSLRHTSKPPSDKPS